MHSEKNVLHGLWEINIKQTEFKENIIGKHHFQKTELAHLGTEMKSKNSRKWAIYQVFRK